MGRIITIGSNIDEMFELREKRRILAEEDKLLKARYDECELALIASLDKQDTTKGAGKKASATINTSIVAEKEDWNLFCAWAAKTKNMHLFQQRISDPAYRELREKLGKPIAGLKDFIKRSIGLRVLN